jgi:NADPH-dependent ferric siderophore reductase
VSRLLELDETERARPQQQIAVVAPNAQHDGPHGGLEFVSSVADDLLLAGDETALPAIAAILERLPGHATGTALIEVPDVADVITLAAPPGIRVAWLPRNGADCGERLTAAATAWRPGSGASEVAGQGMADPDEADRQEEILWDVPEMTNEDATAVVAHGIRAWVAGEAAAVRAIRRHLVGPCGLPRSVVAFMGYWRLGHAEG